ncbi:MAG TPA: 5-formyltetrahydrofolate cyclo-ligase [Bacteroidales bacterium]|nr:5-formyltetrahydrofolate cyclo-ligase [Bacteroidales bacterium]
MLVSKSDFRNEVFKLKRNLTSSERIIKSQSIFKKIEQLQIFNHAKTILIYWSLDDEVFTHDVTKRWNHLKRILLPVTLKEELELREFKGTHLLKESSKMKLKEPVGKAFTAFNEIDMAIVPGLAFDNQNNRIGYGKGYYDKLLSNLSVFKIGICFDFQIFDNISTTERDIKMDMVITN